MTTLVFCVLIIKIEDDGTVLLLRSRNCGRGGTRFVATAATPAAATAATRTRTLTRFVGARGAVRLVRYRCRHRG
jgi:hypothetical protein